MAMTICPGCRKSISNQGRECPNCGRGIDVSSSGNGEAESAEEFDGIRYLKEQEENAKIVKQQYAELYGEENADFLYETEMLHNYSLDLDE